MGLAAFNRMRRLEAEKLAEQTQEGKPETKPLDDMKVTELQEYAKAKNIDLGEATKKAEILAAIQALSGGGENANS